MSIMINIYYTGQNGSARAFAEEMLRSGVGTGVRQLSELADGADWMEG